MRQARKSGKRSDWLLALCAVAAAGLCGTGADAQSVTGNNGVKITAPRQMAPLTAQNTIGSGPYFIEFRSRYAWDYGHTYLVHGKVGEPLTKASVAGLSPVGDDATAWVIGHYVPVPAETGWTDGDLEDKYVSARFRVLMSKEQYDRVMAYVRHLQATSHTWSAELYNCNAFVGDVAKFMGLRAPASSLIYPKVYVTNLRLINSGHPEAADRLISDNMKEMASPTRDGRAMIVSGVHTIAVNNDSSPRTPTPTVTIGPLRATHHAAQTVTSDASR